jgi:predicted Holliday junction resolvase-like endonuclease
VEVEIPAVIIIITIVIIIITTIIVRKVKAVKEGKGMISSQQNSLLIFTRKDIHREKKVEGKCI